MERIGTLTSVGGVVGVSIRARCGVFRPVPGEAFAGRFGLDIVCAVVDDQVERIDAGASEVVGVLVSVSSR